MECDEFFLLTIQPRHWRPRAGMFLVMMMMIKKETQKRLQKMPVLFWVMKLAAFVRRVWNNQHIVDGHGELASTTTKKLRPSD